jgi:hypothetical protein
MCARLWHLSNDSTSRAYSVERKCFQKIPLCSGNLVHHISANKDKELDDATALAMSNSACVNTNSYSPQLAANGCLADNTVTVVTVPLSQLLTPPNHEDDVSTLQCQQLARPGQSCCSGRVSGKKMDTVIKMASGEDAAVIQCTCLSPSRDFNRNYGSLDFVKPKRQSKSTVTTIALGSSGNPPFFRNAIGYVAVAGPPPPTATTIASLGLVEGRVYGATRSDNTPFTIKVITKCYRNQALAECPDTGETTLTLREIAGSGTKSTNMNVIS